MTNKQKNRINLSNDITLIHFRSVSLSLEGELSHGESTFLLLLTEGLLGSLVRHLMFKTQLLVLQ